MGSAAAHTIPGRLGPLIGLKATALFGLLLLILFGLLGLTITSTLLNCGGGRTESTHPGAITRKALREIPRKASGPTVITLAALTELSRRYRIDWHFVASIAAQECDFGRCSGAAEINSSGCGGPMQISMVSGTPCASATPLWTLYKQDGDGDGRKDPFDAEDSLATAIVLLKRSKGAPGPHGSYERYRQAACNYYGACADGYVNYADEVMTRAVAYGMRAPDTPEQLISGELVEGGAQDVALQSAGGCEASAASLTGAGNPDARALLNNPRITWANPALARADLLGGNISPRLIALLDVVTRRHELTVSALSRGHSPGTNHEPGRAADISVVDGEVCNAIEHGRGGRCWQLAQELDAIRGCLHPTELIYYFDPGPSPESFAQSDHADHVHVGYEGPLGSMLTYGAGIAPCSPAALTGEAGGALRADARSPRSRTTAPLA